MNPEYILISTQEEYDNLPNEFDTYKIIKIQQTKDEITIKYKKNSSVEARGSSRVVAHMNSCFYVHSENINGKIYDQSIAIVIECDNVKIEKNGEFATVIHRKKVLYNLEIFKRIYSGNIISENSIKLYKSVDPETKCDFKTGKIKYAGTVVCPDFDKDPMRECGGGLQLSPTKELALSFHPNGLVLECEVRFDEFVIYPYNIDKVRCRVVEAPNE